VHAEADVHDTPVSVVDSPLTVGMDCMAQVVPFQRSASGTPLPELL
jgi:hypothetical protein